jgi:hypothetical protein
VCDLVIKPLGLTDLQLILRGSLAQGVVSNRSDLDFELSSTAHPHGHRGAERLVVDILGTFGLASEASDGRPAEVDIHDSSSGLGRDLYEWMELRRPGSVVHDPGWLADVLQPDPTLLVTVRSSYPSRALPHFQTNSTCCQRSSVMTKPATSSS